MHRGLFRAAARDRLQSRSSGIDVNRDNLDSTDFPTAGYDIATAGVYSRLVERYEATLTASTQFSIRVNASPIVPDAVHARLTVNIGVPRLYFPRHFSLVDTRARLKPEVPIDFN